jgi:hypothetical protein
VVGFVRENPFLAVGIAIGIGYFLGVYRGREIGEKISSAAAGYLMSEGNTLLEQLRKQ